MLIKPSHHSQIGMSACQSISLSNTQTMLFDNDQKPEAIVLNFFFSVIGWLDENPKKTKYRSQHYQVFMAFGFIYTNIAYYPLNEKQ